MRKSTKVVPIPQKLQELIDYFGDNPHEKGAIVRGEDEDGEHNYYIDRTKVPTKVRTNGGRRTKRHRQLKKRTRRR
jgi:hypothetical protein